MTEKIYYAFLELVIDCVDRPASTIIHTLYSGIGDRLLYKKHEKEKQPIGEVVTSEYIGSLKILPKNLSGELKVSNLFTLKSYTIDQITKDIFWVKALDSFGTSPFEHSNFIIKKNMRVAFKARNSTIKKVLKVIVPLVEIGERGRTLVEEYSEHGLFLQQDNLFMLINRR